MKIFVAAVVRSRLDGTVDVGILVRLLPVEERPTAHTEHPEIPLVTRAARTRHTEFCAGARYDRLSRAASGVLATYRTMPCPITRLSSCRPFVLRVALRRDHDDGIGLARAGPCPMKAT
jgi:hypothetical protein